jgi:hypothetical protein
MSGAIGNLEKNVRNNNGQLWFDVRDYGVDPSTSNDCQPGIQEAIDAAFASINYLGAGTTRATVFVPSNRHPYNTSRPIFIDHPGVELIGENWGARINANNDFPTIALGIQRLMVSGNKTHSLDASYRPDASNVLDSSCVSGLGQKHGFRSHKNAFLGFQQTGFDAGMPGDFARLDRWRTANKVTLDILLLPGDITQTSLPIDISPICGMGGLYVESPFEVSASCDSTGNVQMYFWFRTSDMPDWSIYTTHYFAFNLSPSNAGGRITIQADLLNNVFAAWANGTQLAITASNLPSSGNHYFKENYISPFTVFAAGSTQLPFSGMPDSYADLSLYGLHLSNTTRYVVGATGSTQSRIDGKSVNDSTRYFVADDNTLGLLPMTDVANGEAAKLAYRCVPVTCTRSRYAQTAMGFFFSWASGGGQLYNRIENLAINGSGQNKLYGYGIMVGAVLETQIHNCRVDSNGYAIGTPNLGANYTINLSQCYLSGGDSNLYAWSQALTTLDCRFLNMGNYSIKLAGCNADIKNSFFGDSNGSMQCLFGLFGGAYDSQYQIDNFFVDTESGGFARAMVLAQGSAYCGTRLTLRNGSPIMTAPGVLFELQDGGSDTGTWRPSFIDVNLPQLAGGSGIVKLNGSGWRGEIKGSFASLFPRITHTGDFGKDCNVKIIDTDEIRFYGTQILPIVGPPTEGTWYVGAHQYKVSSPQPGQYSEWRCVASGDVGVTPPKFAGIAPVPCTPGLLTGYSSTTETMSVNLQV